VLSHEKVREAAKGVIVVKLDPRNLGDDKAAAMEVFKAYKTTRYVPELVLVAPDGEAIESIDNSDLNPDTLAEKLRKAAEEVSR
jgi:hypothetical protein